MQSDGWWRVEQSGWRVTESGEESGRVGVGGGGGS